MLIRRILFLLLVCLLVPTCLGSARPGRAVWITRADIDKFNQSGQLPTEIALYGEVVMPLELPDLETKPGERILSQAIRYEGETLPAMVKQCRVANARVAFFVRLLDVGAVCRRKIPEEYFEKYKLNQDAKSPFHWRFLSPRFAAVRLSYVKGALKALGAEPGTQVAVDFQQRSNGVFNHSELSRENMINLIGFDPIDSPFIDSSQLKNGFASEREENREAFEKYRVEREKLFVALAKETKTALGSYEVVGCESLRALKLTPIQRIGLGYSLLKMGEGSDIASYLFFADSVAEVNDFIANETKYMKGTGRSLGFVISSDKLGTNIDQTLLERFTFFVKGRL
jgi:hypothetical protein